MSSPYYKSLPLNIIHTASKTASSLAYLQIRTYYILRRRWQRKTSGKNKLSSTE
jgi:hypothetical protein